LIGGGSFLNTYNDPETHNSHYMHRKLTHSFEKKFPQITIQFEQMWSGLIGISKDIAPLAGADKDAPSIYYIAAAAGLSIAAMLGNYSADHLIDGSDQFKNYFSPYRSFPVGGALQSILGNKLSFALSNVINLNVP
jgi:glycine/D-amino acid oxidase-like deaminating enzyme